MSAQMINVDRKYGPARMTVELVNICNLHCEYCLRDEEALYNTRAQYFPVDLLAELIPEARATAGIEQLSFTGGEPTLHPQFAEILETCSAAGMKTSFVTNGWHFEKVWPAILKNSQIVSQVAFSVDGASREQHDRMRGAGSFVKLVKAFTLCFKARLPFAIKVGIRRDTVECLEEIAIFAARMGATSLSFAHLLPTSAETERRFALSLSERQRAEEEIALLGRIFKMGVGIDVGYYNVDIASPCAPLAGASCNIDYHGNLTLCCNLSGFRGSATESDIVADLRKVPFTKAYPRLRQIAQAQHQKRLSALEVFERRDEKPDLYTGSPCLFCLQSFGKLSWAPLPEQFVPATGARALPVVAS